MPIPSVCCYSSPWYIACLLFQGEIHMSDDAIHDILAQTESDPAFQALYDLFDCSKYGLFWICLICSILLNHYFLFLFYYHFYYVSMQNRKLFCCKCLLFVFPDKTRFTDPGDAVNNCCLEGSDTAGPTSLVKPLQSDDPGIPLTSRLSVIRRKDMTPLISVIAHESKNGGRRLHFKKKKLRIVLRLCEWNHSSLIGLFNHGGSSVSLNHCLFILKPVLCTSLDLFCFSE